LKRWLLSLLAWVCVLLGPGGAAFATAPQLADCTPRTSVPAGVLSVAVRPAPPYIFEHSIRGLEGLSIDLWENVAKKLKLDYRYVCMDLNSTLAALQVGSVDIAISPLTISRQREQVFDFSHQYFSSSLVIATRPEAVSFNFDRVLHTMIKIATSSGFLSVIVVFLLITLMLAFISYRHMEHYTPLAKDDMEGRFSFHLHLLLMSGLNTLGMRKDIFSFSHVRVQLLFVLVLMVGSVFSSSLGGMITAVFMSSTEQHFSITADNLAKHQISTLKGSTAERYLSDTLQGSEKAPVTWLRRDSWSEVLDDLASGKADVVIGDWVQMTWLANQTRFKGKVQIDPQTLRLEPHGWGMPTASPLREPVDQELIGVLRNHSWPEVVRSYLGGDQVSAQ